MENNRKMIFVGLVCLLVGALVGRLLCSTESSPLISKGQPSVLEISQSSAPINILDARINFDTARNRIMKFRNDSTVTIKRDITWEVKRSTLETILKQIDESDSLVTAIQFYPAFDQKYEGLTLIMVGRTGEKLIFKQKNGAVGELWDYIGPCPPKICPLGDEQITH